MSDDMLFDAYQREEMESSADTGKHLAFVEAVVAADLMRFLVDLWFHYLHAQRVADHYGLDFHGYEKNLNPKIRQALEEGLTEMYHAFGWERPFQQVLDQKEADWQEDYDRQEANHQDTLQMLSESRATQEQDRKRNKEKLDDELRRLIVHIDGMMNHEVTHSERRGQLKLLQDLIQHVRNTYTDDISDIPF